MVKKIILILVLTCLSPPKLYGQTETVAQLLMEKGLARINNDLRKRVAADLASVDEEYINKEKYDKKEHKSRKSGKKTITGRPKLDRMNVDDLYHAFATRFDFYIDDADSTITIDNVKYVIIKFRPKQNLRFRNATDQFINRLTGVVYIDLENFKIVKIEGAIEYHFDFNYKILGLIPIEIDVYEFRFYVEYTVFNDIVIEKSLGGMADYEVRSRGIENHTYELSNYRIR